MIQANIRRRRASGAQFFREQAEAYREGALALHSAQVRSIAESTARDCEAIADWLERAETGSGVERRPRAAPTRWSSRSI